MSILQQLLGNLGLLGGNPYNKQVSPATPSLIPKEMEGIVKSQGDPISGDLSNRDLLMRMARPQQFNPMTRLGIGLLQAGAPSLTPTNFLGTLGTALGGVQSQADVYQQRGIQNLLGTEKLKQGDEMLALKKLALFQKLSQKDEHFLGKGATGRALKIMVDAEKERLQRSGVKVTPEIESRLKAEAAKHLLNQERMVKGPDEKWYKMNPIGVPPFSTQQAVPRPTDQKRGFSPTGVQSSRFTPISKSETEIQSETIRGNVKTIEDIMAKKDLHMKTGIPGAIKTGPVGSVIRQAQEAMGQKGNLFGKDALILQKKMKEIAIQLRAKIKQEKGKATDKDEERVFDIAAMKETAWQRAFQDSSSIRLNWDLMKRVMKANGIYPGTSQAKPKKKVFKWDPSKGTY